MNNNPKGAKNPKKPLIFYYAVMLLVLMMLNWLLFPSLRQRQVTEVGYDEFIAMVDDGKVPACVRHCPGQARLFGDADDPESDVSKMIAKKQTYKLTDVGNAPSVTYGLDKCEWKGGE